MIARFLMMLSDPRRRASSAREAACDAVARERQAAVRILQANKARKAQDVWNGILEGDEPLLLQPGMEHTIALHAVPGQVLVFVDDALQFTAPGGLSGAVTVYPALDSAIFVREILVDGELACAGPVAGPLVDLK